MRPIHPNAMVAHLWANQSQSEAQSGNGNFWFEDDTIYSYRTPIARHTLGAGGKAYVLRTSETWSVTTTGKHENAISRALDYSLDNVFRVPFVSDRDAAQGNLDYLADKVREATEQALNFRRRLYSQSRTNSIFERQGNDPIRDVRVHLIQQAAETCQHFATAFGLTCPDLEVESRIAALDAKLAKYHSPTATAARERNRATSGERSEKRRLAKERAEASARLLNTERRAFELARWRKHDGPARSAYGLRYSFGEGQVALRISKDGSTLETSQGANVPLEHARKLWPMIDRAHRQGAEYRFDYGAGPRVGQFRVNYVNGTELKAGCHRIPYCEILLIARELGLAPQPEPAPIY